MEELFHLQGFGMTAAVTSAGGQIVSLTAPDGREMMWQRDPAVWGDSSPILFPVCGSVKNNGIRIEDRVYPMTKHGFRKDIPFRPERVGDSFVELVLTESEETLTMYPFRFALHVIYRLVPGGLEALFLTDNRDTRTMPFCLGGHPGLVCPMEEGSDLEDYDLVFPRQEDGTVVTILPGGFTGPEEQLSLEAGGTVLPLRYEEIRQRDTLLFTRLESKSVLLRNRNSGRGLRFDFPGFRALAVWTSGKQQAGYLCLEPWNGLPEAPDESNRIEDKPFVTLLAPGQSSLSSFRITLA